MNQSDLISVIIPVHNGEKYLNKTIRGILRQSYKNIELILVPNNCQDNSIAICNHWAEKDARVKVFVNDAKGTSLARKRGVLESKGKYIVFSDQDDRYITPRAIEGMHDAIVEDGTQIVEFNTYYEPIQHFRRRSPRWYKSNVKFTKKELFDGPLSGAVVGRGDYFSTSVWSKIYFGDMLREAVKNINCALYFAEDSYLNLYAFTNDAVESVSVRNEAYYDWKTGGFSKSEGAGIALLHDYCVAKVKTLNLLKKLNVNESIIYRVCSEGLWCYRAVINQLLRSSERENQALALITELEPSDYIRMTKDYFRTHPENIWSEDMHFMISDYTPQEYLDWCREHLPPLTKKEKLRSVVKKIITS